MNTAAPSRFALVAEYLADFIAGLWLAAAPPLNDCLCSMWADGALDNALKALRAGNATAALSQLGLAASLARSPVGGTPPSAAQQERNRIALAARVATALTHEAMRQPCSQQPHPLAMLQSSHPVHAIDDGAALDLADEDLKPIELPEDFDINFELGDAT